MIESGLTRTSRQRVCLRGVLTILNDVQIETTELAAAEVVDLVVHVVELVGVVCLDQLRLQALGLRHNPTIKRQQLSTFN